jgi:hypothetical protein
MMGAENIYQMFTRLGGAGFFVKRNGWTHPRAAARVMAVRGLTDGALPGGTFAYTWIERPTWWQEWGGM